MTDTKPTLTLTLPQRDGLTVLTLQIEDNVLLIESNYQSDSSYRIPLPELLAFLVPVIPLPELLASLAPELEAENADLKAQLQESEDEHSRSWCRQMISERSDEDILLVAAQAWGRDEALRIWTDEALRNDEYLWESLRYHGDEVAIAKFIKIAHERLDKKFPPK